MVIRKRIHNDVCTRSSVEDIAKDMELIDGEALNEFANSFDKS